MIGCLLNRLLVLVFGYAYPAYECFKTVEKNKPDMEQLRFWCQYWILVAVMTVYDPIGDTFISWLPMYSEAKLAFFVYLWYPKTKGTKHVYESFLRPYLSKHESDIDRTLLELKARAGDILSLYWQRVLSQCQTRVFDVIQIILLQSAMRPQQPQTVDTPKETEDASVKPSVVKTKSSTVNSNGADTGSPATNGDIDDPFKATRGKLRKTGTAVVK